MFTLNQLDELLHKSACDYEIIRHNEPILKTEDADKYFDSSKAAPAFIIKTENGFVALIVSAQNGKIDFKKTGSNIGFATFSLADRLDVKRATGYETGSVPLIGHNLPCFIDKKLLDFDYVYGGTGDSLHTLKINPENIVSLLDGKTVEISKKEMV